MCYLTTTYHTACQHYGRLTNSQPCIRARFDPNLRITGCDDATDHGVDSKNTRCPHCQWRLENPNATLTEWLPPGVPTLMLPLKNSVLDSSIKLPRASETEVRNFDGRTSRSSRSYAQPATPSEGKAVRRTEPPVLRWRTWGGPGVSVKFKKMGSERDADANS